MKKKIFLFVFLFLFYSCKEKTGSATDKNEKIELDTSELSLPADVPEIIETIPIFSSCTNYNNNLSAIAADISFIQMDFDPPFDDNKISDIALSENNIFLSGLYKVMSYDRNGKFLREIGSMGQGPKEYAQINAALQIDPVRKLIYIQDVARKALVFRFDGTFVKNIPIKVGKIALIDSSMIALRSTNNDRKMKPAPLIKFINRDGGDIKTHWSNNYPIPRQPRELLANENFLWNCNNDFYYLEFGADTIFRIAGDTLIPARVLTGNLKLSLIESNRGESGNKLRLYSNIFSQNPCIFESNRFMICRLLSDYEYFITVYDKKEKRFHRTYYDNAAESQLSHTKQMGYFYDDMVSGLNFNPKFQSMGKALALIPAAEIYEKKKEILDFIAKHPHERSNQFKKIVQEITEDDNAVLMLVTFK